MAGLGDFFRGLFGRKRATGQSTTYVASSAPTAGVAASPAPGAATTADVPVTPEPMMSESPATAPPPTAEAALPETAAAPAGTGATIEASQAEQPVDSPAAAAPADMTGPAPEDLPVAVGVYEAVVTYGVIAPIETGPESSEPASAADAAESMDAEPFVAQEVVEELVLVTSTEAPPPEPAPAAEAEALPKAEEPAGQAAPDTDTPPA